MPSTLRTLRPAWTAARARILWLLALALPIILAACNKSGSGSGY